MATVSERLSVHIDDPSLNGKDSFNGHHPRANTVEFLPREVNILSVLAGNALTKQEIICNAWEEVYKKDAHFQFPTTIHQLNERLALIDSPLRVKNTGGRRNATYELVDITPPPPNPIQPPLHDNSRQEAFEQASDYAEEIARGIRRVDPIHHDSSRDEAFAAVAEFDEEQRVARQNQRPPLSPRTQELRARMLAHNPIQPSDGTVIEARMPLGPLVEDSHRALKKISPSPSLQDSIQKFEAFKQEQRRQKVQGRWDQRQQRIETRKRIQEWTHEQQAQITTTQIPEVAEEAERQRQAKAADEVRLEQVRVHFKTEWEDLPERTEDDQVLIDFNQRNEDYKKSQALERDLLLLLRANGHNGVHHYHLKKFARDHGFQSPADLLKQIPGLRKNGMSIRHTLERGGGRFYLNGDVSSLTQESIKEPQTETPTRPIETPVAAPAPVMRAKAAPNQPQPFQIHVAPRTPEKPQKPKPELSAYEKRLKEVKTRLNGPSQMVFDAVLRLQQLNKYTTPEAIAAEAFPSWTPEKAMIRYQKGVDELRVIMNTQGLDITTYFDEAGSTLVNFERTSQKTS